MVKYLNFHNSSFCLKIHFNVNGNATKGLFSFSTSFGRFLYMGGNVTLKLSPLSLHIACHHVMGGHEKGILHY